MIQQHGILLMWVGAVMTLGIKGPFTSLFTPSSTGIHLTKSLFLAHVLVKMGENPSQFSHTDFNTV